MIPKILVVIPTLNDDPSSTIKSLMKQTIAVSKILVAVGSKELLQRLGSMGLGVIDYVYVKPNFEAPLGKRVAEALNRVLSKVQLKDYDYLLRVDADTILPSNFIEENLKANADCVGKSGYAMLFKIDCFVKQLGGRFIETAFEDTHMGLKLLSQGCSVKSWVIPPKLKRKSGAHHSWKYFFSRGIELYKLGYEPLHVIEILRYGIKNSFVLIGYATALLKNTKRYDIAHWVFKTQLKRLVYGKQE